MAQAVMVAEPPKAAMMSMVTAKGDEGLKKNRIQVSNTKKPLFFYLNLAKRYIKQHNDVELSALGMAIPTVVTIAEILKANGVAVEKKVLTSTVGSKDESKGRLVQKAKIEILLEKIEKADDEKTSAETAKTEAAAPEVKTKTAAPEAKAETAAPETKAATGTAAPVAKTEPAVTESKTVSADTEIKKEAQAADAEKKEG